MNTLIIMLRGASSIYFASSSKLASQISAVTMFLKSQLNVARIEAHACMHFATHGRIPSDRGGRFDEVLESLEGLRRKLRDIAGRKACDADEIEKTMRASGDLLMTAFKISKWPSVPERFLVVHDNESRLFFNRHLFLLHEIARAKLPISDRAGMFLERYGMPKGSLGGWFRCARTLILVGMIQRMLRERFGDCFGPTVAMLEVFEETLSIRSRFASLCGRTKVADQVWCRVHNARPQLSRLCDERRQGVVAQRTISDLLQVLSSYRSGFETLEKRQRASDGDESCRNGSGG